MEDRTEEEALAGLLHLTLGGQPVELRTLTLDESDEWLTKLAEEVAAIDIDEDRPADVFRHFLTQASAAALRMLAAYDVEGVLGGEDGIRARKPRKRELRHAVEVMVAAEDPFEPAAVRSVVEAFGAPSLSLWRVTGALAAAGAMQVLSSPQGLSTAGPSPATASDGESFDKRGAASSSSSDGPIPITRSGRKRKSA